MHIYISNLGQNITDELLTATFATYGDVRSSRVMIDGFTGQSRGFAFVEMPNDTEATTAIVKLNGSIIEGHAVAVKEAKPQAEQKGSYAIGSKARK